MATPFFWTQRVQTNRTIVDVICGVIKIAHGNADLDDSFIGRAHFGIRFREKIRLHDAR